MNRLFLILGTGAVILSVLISCKPDSDNKDPQYIVDQAIKVHGSMIFDHSIIEFKFRDRYYKSTRNHGQFRYSRFWDSLGVIIHDELTNDGLSRDVDQTTVTLDIKKIDAYSNSIRAIFYFFALPFGLNDPPVIKEYIGQVTLMDQPYHKIKITFKQNPSDRLIHDDVYVFWIHKTKFTMDYLGYSYTEPDEAGIRFRQAVNPRKVEGLMVQDYINFKPIQDSIALKPEDLDQAWAGNQLVELSKIHIEQLKIRVN